MEARQVELEVLCAAASITLPSIGSYVYYFLEGHIESFSDDGGENYSEIRPHLSIPCRVLGYTCLVHGDDAENALVKIRLQPVKPSDFVLSTGDEAKDRVLMKESDLLSDYKGKGKVHKTDLKRMKRAMMAIGYAAKGHEFDVEFYPRPGSREFIVSADRVNTSTPWEKGMTVMMKTSLDDILSTPKLKMTVDRAGIIEAVHSQISDDHRFLSPWRMLQVRWNDPEMPLKFNHVSPWEVEISPSSLDKNVSSAAACFTELHLKMSESTGHATPAAVDKNVSDPESSNVEAVRESIKKIIHQFMIELRQVINISPCACKEVDCLKACTLRKYLPEVTVDLDLQYRLSELGESYLDLCYKYKELDQLNRALETVEYPCLVFGIGTVPKDKRLDGYARKIFLSNAWRFVGEVYEALGEKEEGKQTCSEGKTRSSQRQRGKKSMSEMMKAKNVKTSGERELLKYLKYVSCGNADYCQQVSKICYEESRKALSESQKDLTELDPSPDPRIAGML